MTNRIEVNEQDFKNLKDKVVVLTGGANGIGKATVTYLANAGAHVVFGDYDSKAGEAVVKSISNSGVQPTFVQIDVSKYADNTKLFRTALDKYGKVDHAVAVAGIAERGKWFDPDLTIESVEKPDSIQTLEINFLGSAYFTRIAVVYLKHGRKEGEDRSITLISSAAGFRDSPGLFMYQCTKHAVMGILRGLRKIIYERDQIRINAICPAMTDTQMTVGMIDKFKETGQSINTPEGVAQQIVGLELDQKMNGKAIYVEGNRGWEIMDGLERTMPDWLGEAPTARMRQHAETVGSGDAWKFDD